MEDDRLYETTVQGVSRIIDSIFVGDVNSSRDIKFVSKYHISHIVNCAGNELNNLF